MDLYIIIHENTAGFGKCTFHIASVKSILLGTNLLEMGAMCSAGLYICKDYMTIHTASDTQPEITRCIYSTSNYACASTDSLLSNYAT